MKIDFVVHNVSSVPRSIKVDRGGTTIAASVEYLEVELTTTHDDHGSLTLRFDPTEAEEARDKFPVGETISWTV